MEPIGLKPTDELIILARNGNGPAFTALWDRHIEQLRVFIRTWLKHLSDLDVDDICSRTFEKAFRQIESYDSSKSLFQTWLRTIARNTALDLIEKEKRAHASGMVAYLDDSSSPAVDVDSGAASPLESIINEEIEQEKIVSISSLPELYRDVAQKRLVEGMSYKEIAQETGLELNTVRTRIRRAKDIMAKMHTES